MGNNFIRQIIDDDLAAGRHTHIITRFPPEPNGYLHIGHAKSICLNFGIAEDYQGRCNLRFDDTNPVREDEEFVNAIEEDVRWLGFEWERLAHASDYFQQLYEYARELIEKHLAYVDDQSHDEIRCARGTLTEAGINSPYRDRSAEQNLKLFEQMKRGDFADGERVLRARIDMAAANINMRDPVIYRIRHHAHQRTGNDWCIYPMYDFTHCLSDAIEGVTHSLCTLEFEDHRALYDWFVENLNVPSRPRQYEFSRLNLDYTVMSKRRLTELVENADVAGWDDPRMPTLSGLRRRGFTPDSIKRFIERVGVTRKDHIIEIAQLENAIREDLDPIAPRVMAVLQPLKMVIENYPEESEEMLQAKNHPNDPSLGDRQLPFSREIYIERDDFLENPPKQFFRLAPGREVRLRYAYLVTCTEIIKDKTGEIVELRCRYDPDSRGGSAPDGRKVKGTLHWVSARHAINAEVRLYDRLFTQPNPLADKSLDFRESLNPDSLRILNKCKLEPQLAHLSDERCQFERLGYFYQDPDSKTGNIAYNRIVTLRDTWGKVKTKQTAAKRL